MEYIYLQGSEDVREAAGTMMTAANRMVQAVNTHDSSLSAFMQFMNGWMDRLEAVVEKLGEQNAVQTVTGGSFSSGSPTCRVVIEPPADSGLPGNYAATTEVQ